MMNSAQLRLFDFIVVVFALVGFVLSCADLRDEAAVCLLVVAGITFWRLFRD
jgi:hypothetical protein